MTQSSTWMMIAGALKLLALAVILVMFGQIGLDLARGHEVNLSFIPWLILTIFVLQISAWAIGRRLGSTPQ